MRRIDLKRANVARPNTIRDINRQIILNYVRERGPISRAEIAQETALQRSTVSLIVDELKSSGLIEEVTGESTGGRPPTLLSLRTADAVAIGVDLGTRRTIVATSDLAGRVLEQEEFPTDPDSRKTISHIIDCSRRFIAKGGATIEGVGVSLPGLVDQETGTASFIPHFKWRDLEIAKEIRSALGLAVTADNDANAAALAELWFGRPEIREVRDFIMVLIEEGIGTGIVFDGQVHRGKNGAAGEFGHMTIGRDAPVACAAGSQGCWEAFASERAALARYAKLKRGACAAFEFGRLVELAFEGEGEAQTALKETAHYLGVGIANLIQGLSPEAVIIGGPIVRAWSLIANDIQTAARENICRGLPLAQIIASTLGAEPTLMGALSLVLMTKFTHVSLS
ncbi:MAG: ROK family transcriptional regulator [Acidobacteria bacterium]|nr:ROK family transcriptional regulator [Acidobacteriota bacterium]